MERRFLSNDNQPPDSYLSILFLFVVLTLYHVYFIFFFFLRYRDRPEVEKWQKMTKANAKQNGYVRTILGRYVQFN